MHDPRDRCVPQGFAGSATAAKSNAIVSADLQTQLRLSTQRADDQLVTARGDIPAADKLNLLRHESDLAGLPAPNRNVKSRAWSGLGERNLVRTLQSFTQESPVRIRSAAHDLLIPHRATVRRTESLAPGLLVAMDAR